MMTCGLEMLSTGTSQLGREHSQGNMHTGRRVTELINPPPPRLPPVQAQTCSLGCRKVTGCRQSTCWSSRQCISHRSCWKSWPAMLKGCTRRREGEGRGRVGAGGGGLRLPRVQRGGCRVGRGRGQVGRGGVSGRVGIRG